MTPGTRDKGKEVRGTMQWEHERFTMWLRLQRRVIKPMSQEALADQIGSTQEKISRWEAGPESWPNVSPPTLEECMGLSDVFDANFIDLARMCGRWNDELEQRVVTALASNGDDNADDQKGALANAHNPRSVVHSNVVPLPVQVCADAQVCRDSDRLQQVA